MAAHIHRLGDMIVAEAGAKGYEPIAARDEECGSGIVTLVKPGIDAAETAVKMASKGVSVSPRAGGIRAAPHFYQNDADIRRFVDLLP